jgi:hypothetical protein
MARCAECNTEIPDGIRHYFCGYGWYAQFCAACCPRKMDGTECDDEHPAPDLDTLIDSITEHSGPAHILPGPHVEEVVREVLAPKDIKVWKIEDMVWKTVTRDPTDPLGMTYLYEPDDAASELPRAEAEDAVAPQPSSDGLTWRQKPAQF